MPRITILTDFGTRDGYVASMKGVLASLAPDVLLDDVAHDLPQGDVAQASWALGRYWRRFPEGTVHLVVVDPGVGTRRRALAMEADGRFVVVPDNGAISRVVEQAESWQAVELTSGRFVDGELSATFHGRDLFAPAAAHLARGRPLEELGDRVEDPMHLSEPEPKEVEAGLLGEVISEDYFGNLVTNVSGPSLKGRAKVEIQGRLIPILTTYGDAEDGQLLALANSDNRLEVAARNGSAAVELGAGVGTPVKVLPPEL